MLGRLVLGQLSPNYGDWGQKDEKTLGNHRFVWFSNGLFSGFYMVFTWFSTGFGLIFHLPIGFFRYPVFLTQGLD